MLQPTAPQSVMYEDYGQSFDPAYLIGLLKRRIFYFVIPFLLVVLLGAGVVAIQRPIYRAEGKILVESPEIPPELVHPTITEVANERVQVIQQRIMARDNLMAVVNKFDLFTRERQWMSSTELLELVRSRMEIKPVELDAVRTNNPTIAFTLSFDYEVPTLAARVANDFLTSILSEDATTRTNNAAETTKFLEREVSRLQSERDAILSQMATIKQHPDPDQTQSEESKEQMKNLADAQSQLLQASAVYSDEHPIVRNLKKKIAALKRAISATPQPGTTPDASKPDSSNSSQLNLQVLDRREAELGKSIEDTNQKLRVARLGESMERAQQGERLRVIEQPSVPQKPVRPQRVKWYGIAFALAGMVGAAAVFAAEMLDGSIRGSRELARVVDRHLIVTIPYFVTPGEQYRRRRNFILLCTALIAIFAGLVAVAVINGVSVDFLWLDRPWLDTFTRILR
jgi:capsular polysaccharide biosynthesis protein